MAAKKKTRRKRISRAPGARAQRRVAKKAKNPGVKMQKRKPKGWIKAKAVKIVGRKVYVKR